MSSEAIVLYPSPAIGHLISMVELGRLILSHKPSLHVHVLVSGSAYSSGDVDSYISSLSSISTITFHRLPSVSLPPATASLSPHHEILTFHTLRLNIPNVRTALLDVLSHHCPVKALVMDFFCFEASSVATELGIAPFYFFTSPAGCLALMLRLPEIHEVIGSGRVRVSERAGLVFDVPGIPPVRHSDVPMPFKDPEDPAARMFARCSVQMKGSAGIIVNTFEELEGRTIRAVSGGSGRVGPPVYAIGPLVRAGGGARPDCMRWLDTQPGGSVVFLCFGSLGAFSREQVREIAVGLERSGARFLWVVRDPPEMSTGRPVDISGGSDPDLEALLPGGFLGRVGGRGFVVGRWAPQVEVLAHGAVGGFVTHSGWNSVLEAVCAGVPMVSWPLYAEQRLNRILLVEEMGIAFPMEEGEGGFVTAEEVERRVRQLMDSPEGRSARERVRALKHEAEAALKDGGSSRVALDKLVQFKT